jgi:hypothetical protein
MCQSKAGKGKKADPHAHVDNLSSLGLPIHFALMKKAPHGLGYPMYWESINA